MNPSVTVYLGLGSNLHQPITQLQSARQHIAQHSAMTELAFSPLYQSPPLAGMDQPDYINAVMAIQTSLAPLALLSELQAIENQHGRVREQRWGARTLDIDLLLYGEQAIDLPNLIIPHRELIYRAFVLYPLYDIAPELMIPTHGSLSVLLSHCPAMNLQRLF